MKFALLFATLTLAATPCLAEDTAKAQIQEVVDRFQAAIKAHDAQALGTMFLPDSKAWITALGEQTYQKVRQKHPEATPFKTGTWQQFSAYVGNAKEPIEERFHNVRIDTDGTIASVYFDFEFLSAGKVGNRGAETWQLLHTPDGWKIVAMLYSSNF
jgi:ketosteroid isomerase-like protein